MKSIPLGKLILIYEVGREGNITRAANNLNLSQSALSKAITALEEQMDTELFKRVPSGVRMTPQGERLYAFAEKMLQQANSFGRIFYEKEDEVEGEIKIITTPFVGSEWLTPNLDEFLSKYPGIKPRIYTTNENININETDVAICTYIPHQPHLMQMPLLDARIKLFASHSYLKKNGVPENPEDLDRHKLITFKDNYYSPYGSTNWVLNVGNRSEIPRESYFVINSLQGMFNAALKGYGIVELPDYPIITDSELVEVLPQLKGEVIPLYFTFLKHRQNSKKINLLYRYLLKKSK
ncbi:LysR family transcriptional regulator [Candidatus Odyssella thessalonicensis]|uniref:LysR family transcriptional regulator n=1 Tax=Candidatus Odyssella thessalonicensis TaxID=84647 RepID=UPI000225A9EE|nr:LysR family transcriptional regulator [Candidatus Odyssella thessalonicensis]